MSTDLLWGLALEVSAFLLSLDLTLWYFWHRSTAAPER